MRLSLILNRGGGKNPFIRTGGRSGRVLLRSVETMLQAFPTQGVQGSARLLSRPTIVASTAQAYGTVTLATVLAADTVTINGANMTAVNGGPSGDQFDMSGTDIADATSFVTFLNASSTALLQHVKATNKQAIITCATVVTGNWVEIDGVRLTARTGTAAVTTGLAVGEFSMNGTDAQDATSLAACINEHPTLSQIVFAVASSATVIVYERAPSLGQPIPISTSGATLAITGSVTALTASAVVYLESVVPGIGGNAVTLASSNGSRLAVSGARLTGGAATTYTY